MAQGMIIIYHLAVGHPQLGSSGSESVILGTLCCSTAACEAQSDSVADNSAAPTRSHCTDSMDREI